MYWNPPKRSLTLARKSKLKIRNSPPYSNFVFLFAALSVHISFDQEDWNMAFMPNFGDGGAMDNVGNQSVPVGGHGDEITMLGSGGFENGACRLSTFMPHCDAQVLVPKFRADLLQIFPIHSDFLGIGKIQVFLPLRRPPGRNVQQEKFGARQARQFLDVRQQESVSFAEIKRDKN